MKVYDCFTFFNELDLLELRLAELSQAVDYFVVVEADRTFRGQPREMQFQGARGRYAVWDKKIVYIPVTDMPRFDGDPWKLEAFQRRAIIRGLANAAADDIVLVSDVDEIPSAEAVLSIRGGVRADEVVCFGQLMAYHHLNWCSSAPWAGTKALLRRNLHDPHRLRDVALPKRGRPLRQAFRQLQWISKSYRVFGRYLSRRVIEDGGWHFSSLGGAEAVREKIKAYSHVEFDTPEYVGEGVIEARLASGHNAYGQRLEEIPLTRLPRAVQADPERYSDLLR